MSDFKANPGQVRAQVMMNGPATHQGLYGGSRSGKTFWLLRAIALRAKVAPGSRHAVLRFRFNHCKQSIVHDTWPKMADMCLGSDGWRLDRQDWFAELPNGSQVWFGGLDDKQRVEKVLGNEYATIFLNEVSQISWSARNMAVTRLAQKVRLKKPVRGREHLSLRFYYDLNPTFKGHWSNVLFNLKRDPETRELLPHPDRYAVEQMNPLDNIENLPPGYLEELDSMPARFRLRFRDGEYADDNPNALFSDTDIEKWRALDGDLPDLIRIIVGVDPSGSGDEDNADNDEIGVVVGGLGVDGNAYLLEDLTLKAGPGVWGKAATSAFERHGADLIVGETNYGGDMVRFVVQTAKAGVPFKKVTATRGKVVRAEPFSALYTDGKVRHAGRFPKLEDELTAFSTHGYTGEGSPNRADAWIWVLAELFPGLVATKKEPTEAPRAPSAPPVGAGGWMAA